MRELSNYPPGVTESEFEDVLCEVCGEMECECGERVHYAECDAVAVMMRTEPGYDDLPF